MFHKMFFCGTVISSVLAVSFVFAQDLAVPELLVPKNGSTVSATPQLDWSTVSKTEWYELYVGTESWEIAGGASAYKIKSSEALLPGTYQWGVWACNSDGCSESTVWTFTVAAGTPSSPQLTSPCGQSNVSLTPVFTWSKVSADHYYVHISDFGSRILTFQTSLNIGSGDFGSLEAGKNYSWYVEACSAEEKCSNSSSCGFVTKSSTSGGSPTGGSPTGGSPTGGSCPAGQICNPLKYGNFEDLIKAIINDFLIPVGITVAGIMFVIAGALFVTSAGDPEKVRTARRVMIYTAVGLAVILLASGLIAVLQSILGSPTS